MNLISIREGVARIADYRFRRPLNFDLDEGEVLAVVGPNGGGKSMLVDVLTGKHALLNASADAGLLRSVPVSLVTFRDMYGGGEGAAYHQQRWNQWDHEEIPVVRTLLPDAPDLGQWLRLFCLEHVLDERTIMLSSGELRKSSCYGCWSSVRGCWSSKIRSSASTRRRGRS